MDVDELMFLIRRFGRRARNFHKARPILKDFGDLNLEDFKKHPVWVAVHGLDQEEFWYDDDEVDEATFRPWLGALPVEAGNMYLVSASFTFADGTTHEGFVSPIKKYDKISDMGFLQPHIFAPSGEMCQFWSGILKWLDTYIPNFYQWFAKSPEQVFPIFFQPLPGLTSSVGSGEILGFMSMSGNDVEVTRDL